jgi:hypothetical protein
LFGRCRVVSRLLAAALLLAGCRRPSPAPTLAASATASATSSAIAAATAAPPPAVSSLPVPDEQAAKTARTASYRISALGTRRCPSRPYERFAPGKSRLGVELAIEATGSRTIVVDAYYARLHDAEGREYAPTFGGCEPDLRHVRLAPGARARGWVSFEWSEKATAVSLTYNPDLGDAGRTEPSTVKLE